MLTCDRESVPGSAAHWKSGTAQCWEWALFAAAVLALFFRLPFGVDITDEAFYAAEPYLIARGAVPLVDNWSQTPLTFLLTAPLVWLYVRLSGGTEGLGINLSNTIAWAISVLVAFLSNKAFVFQKGDWSPQALLREGGMFVGSRVLSGIVGVGLVPVLMKLGITQSVLGIPGFAAKFLAECVAMILSYFLSKYAVFRK